MTVAGGVLAVNDDLPIRTDLPVHSGKVRSVYWLTKQDSARLIQEKGYDVPADTELAIMVISDRISAFDCIWKGEGDLRGDVFLRHRLSRDGQRRGEDPFRRRGRRGDRRKGQRESGRASRDGGGGFFLPAERTPRRLSFRGQRGYRRTAPSGL